MQDNKLKYLFISANIRKSNTQYHVDDIVTSPNLQSKFMLVCLQEGTTDSNEPVLDTAEEGQEITDGTAKWRVFSKLDSGITVGEEEPVNARDNAVWLALNGVDNIAQLKYQKDGEWKQVYTDSILNAVKDCPIKSLLRNTAYKVSDIVADGTCKGAFLVCTGSGTTGASVASGLATASEGQEITDGTAKFTVHFFKEIVSSKDIMKGATSSAEGSAGLVPKPVAGDNERVLFGDGTFKNVVQNLNTTAVNTASDFNNFTESGSYYFIYLDHPNNPTGSAINGFLIVEGQGGESGYYLQTFYQAGAVGDTKKSIYFRKCIGGTWTEWSLLRSVIESYTSGTSWYRVYSDGWVEQGGRADSFGNETRTITLLKPMADKNYNIKTEIAGTASAGTYDAPMRSANALSTTQITITYRPPSSNQSIFWEVKGQGA